MKELIDQLDEVYQDIWCQGELIAKGVRDCEGRGRLIIPHINPHDVILDVGSAQGYFSTEIARRFPDSLVISFESDSVSCEIQKEVCRREGLYNIVICNHRLSPSDIYKWYGCVECFDKILALSVLHHVELGHVMSVFDALLLMCKQMITEVPSHSENACGGDAIHDSIEATLYGNILGFVESHLGGNRCVKLHTNVNTNRGDLDAFIGIPHEGNTKFEISQALNGWLINGKFAIQGVNVHNLMQFKPVWPEKKWWVSQMWSAYDSLDWKSDVRLWNLLMTSTGLKAIDFMTKFPEGDQAEYKGDEDLRKMERYIHEHTK